MGDESVDREKNRYTHIQAFLRARMHYEHEIKYIVVGSEYWQQDWDFCKQDSIKACILQYL